LSLNLINPHRFVIEADEFGSMYESFNPLTTVMKQHVVSWFTGDENNTDRWNTDVTGSGTATMSDSENGGLVLETSNGTNHATEINFDGIRQYAPQASVFICVFKPDVNYSNTNHFSDVGLIAGTSFYAGGQMLMCEAHSGQTYIRFRYASETWADTSVAFNENRMVTKIESTDSKLNNIT